MWTTVDTVIETSAPALSPHSVYDVVLHTGARMRVYVGADGLARTLRMAVVIDATHIASATRR
jgi:hypothetical protein